MIKRRRRKKAQKEKPQQQQQEVDAFNTFATVWQTKFYFYYAVVIIVTIRFTYQFHISLLNAVAFS